MANTVYCKLQVISNVSREHVEEWLNDDEVSYDEDTETYSWTSRGAPDVVSVFQFHTIRGGCFTFSYEDVLANVECTISFKDSPTHTEIYKDNDDPVDTTEAEFPTDHPLKWLPF